jgi:hypothetical protein
MIATATFIAGHGFSATGLFPFDVRKPLACEYVRPCDDDESQRESQKPRLLPTGSRVLTDPALMLLLTSRLAPKGVAEPERKNLALERLTGPREVGILNPDPDPDAEGEDGEPAEIEVREPQRHTFPELLAESERVAPSAPSDGRIRAR